MVEFGGFVINPELALFLRDGKFSFLKKITITEQSTVSCRLTWTLLHNISKKKKLLCFTIVILQLLMEHSYKFIFLPEINSWFIIYVFIWSIVYIKHWLLLLKDQHFIPGQNQRELKISVYEELLSAGLSLRLSCRLAVKIFRFLKKILRIPLRLPGSRSNRIGNIVDLWSATKSCNLKLFKTQPIK